MQRPRCVRNLKYAGVPPNSRVIKGNSSFVIEVKHTIKDLPVQGLNTLTIRMLPFQLHHQITIS